MNKRMNENEFSLLMIWPKHLPILYHVDHSQASSEMEFCCLQIVNHGNIYIFPCVIN